MISMNWSPPRAMAPKSVAALPAAKARMRKSDMSSIGSLMRCSYTTKTARSTGPPTRPASTQGLNQPIEEVP